MGGPNGTASVIFHREDQFDSMWRPVKSVVPPPKDSFEDLLPPSTHSKNNQENQDTLHQELNISPSYSKTNQDSKSSNFPNYENGNWRLGLGYISC